MKKLTAMVAAFTMILAMAPVRLGAAEAATGQIRGTVIDRSGLPLTPGLQARLVNSLGNTVPGMTTSVARDGAYAFNSVEPGMYTVQLVGAAGMSAVAVSAGKVSTADVTMQTKPGAGAGVSTATKAVIALALIGGTIVTIVIVKKGDASGSN